MALWSLYNVANSQPKVQIVSHAVNNLIPPVLVDSIKQNMP